MHIKGHYLAASSSSNPNRTSRRQQVCFRWLKEISLWRPKSAFLMQYVTFRMLVTYRCTSLSWKAGLINRICETLMKAINSIRPDLLCYCCHWEAPVTEIAFVSQDCGKQSTHFSLLSSFRASRSLNVGLINSESRVWTLQIGKRARKKKYVA